MKKRHSAVLQNAWGKKNKHSNWKNNSGLKNPINSYEKTAQHRLTKCLKPKNKHCHWKNNSGPKNHKIHMPKRHSTVLQNAWGQKKQTLSLKKQFWS